MTNEFAIERLTLFVKHYEGENREVFEKAIESLEKQITRENLREAVRNYNQGYGDKIPYKSVDKIADALGME